MGSGSSRSKDGQPSDEEPGGAAAGRAVEMSVVGKNVDSKLQPEPEQRPKLEPEQSQHPLDSEADGATLWVGNIPDVLLQETDGVKKVEAELRRVFFAHGVATAVSVRKKDAGANKSWAFVTFASAESVQKAVQNDNFVACPDGSRVQLTVKVADVQAQIKKRAITPDASGSPAGAMETMWSAQHKQVLQGLRTPMQEILESLHDIAATVPSVAGKIDHVMAMLTSTENLWSIDPAGRGGGRSLASDSFRDVEDEDVKSYLRSHQNLQLQESHAYSQELMRRRAATRKGRRGAVVAESTSGEINDSSSYILRVLPEISDEARIELRQWESKIDSWDFDIFRVNELTNGAPLAFVLFAVFSRYDLLNKLQLEERAVISLAHALDAGYTQQSVAPYHNNIHGADVVQALCYFIRTHLHDRLVETEILAAVLAAAVHDIAHPAVSNHFHVETSSPMAMLYNDQSVNENHHLSSGFAILQKPQHDILSHMSRSDRKGVRSMIIRLVLATDLANHFDYIARLNTKLDSAQAAISSPRASSTVPSFDEVPADSASKPSLPSASLEPLTLMETAMKMSDVANGARVSKTYNEWSERVFKEFYLQGDQEAKSGLPISSFMDRSNPKELQCQSSFLQYIVGPLYAVGKRIWPDMSSPAAQLEANKQDLENRAEKAARAAKAAKKAKAS